MARQSVGSVWQSRFLNLGRQQPAFAVSGQHHSRLIKIDPVPKLAGDLAMALIQRLAVIGIQAETHRGAATQRLLGLIEVMYAAGEHNRCVESGTADF